MFRAGIDWAGLVVGLAAVAAREYLRRPKMALHKDLSDARQTLREMLWEARERHLENLLFHTCEVHELTVLLVETAGWHVECFTMAALANERAVLGD